MKSLTFADKTIPVDAELKDLIQDYVAYATLNWIQASVIDRKRDILSDIEASLKNSLLEAYKADMTDLTDDQLDDMSEMIEDAWDDKDDAAFIGECMALFK